MMAEMYYVSAWKGNLSKNKKDFTRVQPAKPQKEIRKKHYLRPAYPCSEKVKHICISSISGSTKYTSIKD